MPATDEFNAASFKPPANYHVAVKNDQMLLATNYSEQRDHASVYTFDFLNRVVFVAQRDGGSAMPFRDFDKVSLEWHYNKMLEAGKHPRPPEFLEPRQALPGKPATLKL